MLVKNSNRAQSGLSSPHFPHHHQLHLQPISNSSIIISLYLRATPPVWAARITNPSCKSELKTETKATEDGIGEGGAPPRGVAYKIAKRKQHSIASRPTIVNNKCEIQYIKCTWHITNLLSSTIGFVVYSQPSNVSISSSCLLIDNKI